VLSVGRWLFANAGIIALILFVGVPSLLLKQVQPLINRTTSNLPPNSVDAQIVNFITNYITTIVMR